MRTPPPLPLLGVDVQLRRKTLSFHLEQSLEDRGGIEAGKLEGYEGRGAIALPKRRRENHAHQQINEFLVFFQDGEVFDGFP